MDLDTDLVSAVKAARDESSSMALDDDAAAEHLELSHSTSIEPGLVLVLDTNIVLSHLDLLSEALNALQAQLRFSSASPSLALVIPSVVLRELDSLKSSTKRVNSNQELGFLARSAHTLLLSFISCPALRIQRKHERYALDMVAPNNDDLVLDCALFFHSALPGRIGVISNDANLRLKVIAEQLPALSLSPTDSFTILLTALHPDLPAQFGLQPEAKQIDPVKHFDEEDMPMSDAPPVADIDDPDTLLAIISFTLNNHLPRIVHQQLVKALDQDTVEHLLRHFPPVDRWNSSTSLKVLEKHWSSLEYLWGDTEPVALSQAASGGTSVSQWSAAATTSKQPSQRLASDGLGLSRSQMRDFRQSSIPSLISLLEGTPSKSKKSSTRSQVNGASLSTYALGDHPASWSAAQWSTLWVDLELLLLRGRLLDDSLKSSASRATAQQWLQKWRTSSRSTCRR